jgi:hypothetical protein
MKEQTITRYIEQMNRYKQYGKKISQAAGLMILTNLARPYVKQ